MTHIITNKIQICDKQSGKCGTLSFGTPDEEQITNGKQYVIPKEKYTTADKIKETFTITDPDMNVIDHAGGNRTRRQRRKNRTSRRHR